MATVKRIILVPGWGETHLTVAKLAAILVELGFAPEAVKRTPARAAKASMEQRAHDILKVIDKDGTPPATVLAHSLGALDAVRAAELEPGRFEHLILFNPAGITGPISRLKLSWRFARKKLADHKHRATRIHPGPRATSWWHQFHQGMAAATTDLRFRLPKLVEQGTRVTVLASRNDMLFEFNKIKAGLHYTPAARFVEIQGRHDSIHHEAEDFRAVLRKIL